MDNPRAEKVAVVTEVRERFERSNAAILTEYRGLTVKDLAGLRRTLREAGSEYKIYKNTLVRFAANDLGLGELQALLVGPTAIAFVDGDAAAVAKALRDYARTNPKLTVKGGVLGNKVISVADATALADLPPREVVLARLAGALASPMQTFAGLLQALPRSFAYGLKALIEKRGGVPEGTAQDDDVAEATATEGQDSTPATPSEPAESAVSASTSEQAASATAVSEPAESAVSTIPEPAPTESAVSAETVTDSVSAAISEPPLTESPHGGDKPASALVADTAPTDSGPAQSAAAADPEPAAPAMAPAPEPAMAPAPEPAAAAAPSAAAAPELAGSAAATTAAAEPEAPPAPTAADPEPAAPAAAAEPDPIPEAVEPPELEDAAEAAKTPALVDEPAEVEPLAAHGIPAAVEPEILSVEPSPDAEPEPTIDARAVTGASNEMPPAAATAPDVATPPAT